MKDIYSLAVCVLELMVGKFSGSREEIDLSAIPNAWSEK